MTEQEETAPTVETVKNEFEQFALDPAIIKALNKMGFIKPSAVQQHTIPLIQAGKDLIALSQTGSGKTAACAIPICNQALIEKKQIQTLIIVPTRELALQYATEVQKIGRYKGVQTLAIFGGKDADIQQSKLKHGVQVLVATPGRLMDFIYSQQIDLSNVTTLILDEADEMLSMGFYDDLDFIIQCLVHEHQTLLFSATMSASVKKLAQQYMQTPIEVNLIADQASPQLLQHLFLYCSIHDRNQELIQVLSDSLVSQAIIFCHSRFQVEKVCQLLKKNFSAVDYLHAGLAQEIRSIVTNKFRQKKIKFLVATDIAARGLDFSHVSHVVIYQLPKDPEVYVHRSGRAGRYGKEGRVISLVTKQELAFLPKISQQINQSITWLKAPPLSSLDHRHHHHSRPKRVSKRKLKPKE